VTPEKLAMIEAAENVLRDLGFHDVRVRHHELRIANNQSPTAKALPSTLNCPPNAFGAQSSTSHLARIELGPAEIPRFLEDGITTKVAEALKKIGYAHVTLDLQGYRRGSVNQAPTKGA
jgi:uncharacterized protein